MSGYRISEAAKLAGFTTSALRFYEGEGLLPAPARSASGYRSYDDAAISRLRFVHRARQLGLGLDAIRDLVSVWDAGECAPVQHGFARQIAVHRHDVAARLVELTALHQELLTAERTLTAADSDQACGPECACLASPDPYLTAGEPLLACTLTGSDISQRMQDWADLVAAAASRETVAGGERLEFCPATPAMAARIGELCALEQACCAFFTFDLTFAADRITLQVSAPEDARGLVTALLAGAA